MVHRRSEAAFSISTTRKADPLVLTFESRFDAIILSGVKLAEPQLGLTSAMSASRLGAPAELCVWLVGARWVAPAARPRKTSSGTDSGALALDLRHPGESHAPHSS